MKTIEKPRMRLLVSPQMVPDAISPKLLATLTWSNEDEDNIIACLHKSCVLSHLNTDGFWLNFFVLEKQLGEILLKLSGC